MNPSSLFKQLLKLKIDFAFNASRRNKKVVWWVALYYPGGYEIVEGKSCEEVLKKVERFMKKRK